VAVRAGSPSGARTGSRLTQWCHLGVIPARRRPVGTTRWAQTPGWHHSVCWVRPTGGGGLGPRNAPAPTLSRVRSLAQPAFPDDDGRADATLAAALEEHGRAPAQTAVLAAVCRARLLVPVVPVVAVGTAVEHGPAGLIGDQEADMSAVLMRGRDGREALLAFSSLQRLLQWDPASRPVPVRAADAARAASTQGAVALLIDVAGPVPFAVAGDDLAQLAAGHVLVPAGGAYAWAIPAG